MPGYDVTSWYGLAFPAGTPAAIVEKTNKAMRELLARDTVRAQILKVGALVRSLDARTSSRPISRARSRNGRRSARRPASSSSNSSRPCPDRPIRYQCATGAIRPCHFEVTRGRQTRLRSSSAARCARAPTMPRWRGNCRRWRRPAWRFAPRRRSRKFRSTISTSAGVRGFPADVDGLGRRRSAAPTRVDHRLARIQLVDPGRPEERDRLGVAHEGRSRSRASRWRCSPAPAASWAARACSITCA